MEAPESALHRIMHERAEKAESLRASGKNPYANDFKPSVTCAEFHGRYAQHSREQLAEDTTEYKIAGRVMAVRNMGKAAFVRIQDRSGALQIFVQQNKLGENFETLALVDVGDFIGVTGTPMRTKTEELSLNATTLQLLTKSLRPLPEKWHGLTNVEQRYRQRYLDLIVNDKARDIFRARFRVIREMQKFLDARDFVEVETPILMDIAGGAAARPFLTHHNALDEKLTLRIATELHLKRLVVGGFERVYEIGRIFRNEGVSTTHNPEFTSIEFYQAYATYLDLMDLSEELIRHLVQSVHGKLQTTWQGEEIDFAKPFRRVSIARVVGEGLGMPEEELVKLEQITSVKKALEIAVGHTVTFDEPLKICLAEISSDEVEKFAPGLLSAQSPALYQKLGTALDAEWLPDNKIRARRLALHLLYAVFEHTVEKKLMQPTFILDFPVSVSPLARRRDGDPAVVDRFELFCGGMEVANAFSELNDPIDQRQRFEAQARDKAKGNLEAQDVDEDFLRALEVGMPPLAGEGIGIDRLLMLLMDSPSIREVILFPKMRAR